MTVKRYRSKPQEVEAVKWTGDNIEELIAFLGPKVRHTERRTTRGVAREIEILAGQDGVTGWVNVPLGHVIACWYDDPSDYWPVDPDHFAGKYEEVHPGEE